VGHAEENCAWDRDHRGRNQYCLKLRNRTNRTCTAERERKKSKENNLHLSKKKRENGENRKKKRGGGRELPLGEGNFEGREKL